MKYSVGNRILMLLENNPYPRDARVRQEAKALVGAGYEVTVICPKGKGQPWNDLIDNVRVYRFPMPAQGNGLFGYLWEYGYSLLAALCLSLYVFFRHGFDVIHAHNPPDLMVLVALLYKPLGKKFVFDHHDLAPEMYFARFEGKGNPIVYRLLVAFEMLSCKVADHLIATNNSYKAMQMQRSGIAESRITVVRNGPDLNRLHLVAPNAELQQKAPHIIGYVGEMGVHDGIDYLLRACYYLVNVLERQDFYCVIIGTGDAWEMLKEQAVKLKLEEYVWFPGRVSDADLLSYLSTAQICVDPDPSNPFNDRCSMIKMSEYMALSKPIVAFDLPEHRVTAQEAALYAKANNELDFAQQLATLMDDPQRRQAMGKLGRERVESVLAWSHQSKALIKVYDQLCALSKQRVAIDHQQEINLS
ncbi:MAG: glycosyltransferase family 4 protein [Caldilineaceae bacterium]